MEPRPPNKLKLDRLPNKLVELRLPREASKEGFRKAKKVLPFMAYSFALISELVKDGVQLQDAIDLAMDEEFRERLADVLDQDEDDDQDVVQEEINEAVEQSVESLSVVARSLS